MIVNNPPLSKENVLISIKSNYISIVFVIVNSLRKYFTKKKKANTKDVPKSLLNSDEINQ